MEKIIELFGHVVISTRRARELADREAYWVIVKYLKAGGSLWSISSSRAHFERSATLSDRAAWKVLHDDDKKMLFPNEILDFNHSVHGELLRHDSSKLSLH